MDWVWWLTEHSSAIARFGLHGPVYSVWTPEMSSLATQTGLVCFDQVLFQTANDLQQNSFVYSHFLGCYSQRSQQRAFALALEAPLKTCIASCSGLTGDCWLLWTGPTTTCRRECPGRSAKQDRTFTLLLAALFQLFQKASRWGSTTCLFRWLNFSGSDPHRTTALLTHFARVLRWLRVFWELVMDSYTLNWRSQSIFLSFLSNRFAPASHSRSSWLASCCQKARIGFFCSLAF